VIIARCTAVMSNNTLHIYHQSTDILASKTRHVENDRQQQLLCGPVLQLPGVFSLECSMPIFDNQNTNVSVKGEKQTWNFDGVGAIVVHKVQ